MRSGVAGRLETGDADATGAADDAPADGLADGPADGPAGLVGATDPVDPPHPATRIASATAWNRCRVTAR